MNADAAHVPDAFAAWTTPDADALDRRSLAEWIDGLDVSPLGTLAIDAQMTSDNGVRSAWQSYLGNLAMIKGGGLEKYWTDTERFHCAGGNQQLAERLAAAIGRERVRLREPVTAVPVEGSRVTVATAARSYEAEYAVRVRSGKSFQLPVSSRQLSRKPIFLDSWNLNAGGWKLAAIGVP
jgi:monoamine oxidase